MPVAAGRAPQARAPAKPSKARARAAHEQAALGARLGQQGRHAEAITALRRSVELDPTVASVQHNLGFACLEAGGLDEAASAFTNAVRLNPDLATAHYGLAMALDRLGRVSDAFSSYEAAVKLNPALHLAQFRLGHIYLGRGGHWAKAAAAFRAAAAAAPAGSAQARISAACAADAAGDGAEAQALLRAVIATDPACGAAHLVLGEILAKAGEIDGGGHLLRARHHPTAGRHRGVARICHEHEVHRRGHRR